MHESIACLDLHEWIYRPSNVFFKDRAFICKNGFREWVPYFIFADMSQFESIIVYFTKLTL